MPFPRRGRSEAVQLLHNIKLCAGMLLEGENQSNSKNQRHHIIFLAQEAENICGCRPWNIPSEDGSTMCWVVGSVCFHQVLSVFFFARFCLQKILIRLWKRSEARNWNLFAIARRIVSGEFAFCILVSEVSLIFYILTFDFTKYFQSLTNITQIALHIERTESRAT